EEILPRGHAIEARVYAEDPTRGFLPQAGTLLTYRAPHAPGIRVDSGVAEGSSVPVFYDALIAKMIATAETRATAIARLVSALRAFHVAGVETNIPYLRAILGHPRFVSGDVDTGFLEREAATLIQSTVDSRQSAPARQSWDPWDGAWTGRTYQAASRDE